jgi:acetyl esterase/lipase
MLTKKNTMNFIRPYKGFFLLLVIICSTACNKQKTTTAVLPTADNITMLNVAYGTDPQQIMDIYLPAGRTADTTKVLLLIHGGGWIQGDKTDYDISGFRSLFPTYAIFNVNYRLGNETTMMNPFPAQELDIKAAVQFIYDNRATYSISDNWCYLGGSAGGHLALLQAYKYTTPIRPKVVVDYYGPTDLVDLYNYNSTSAFFQPLIYFMLGGTPAENPSMYTASSPMTYVNASCPKTIILQGAMDSTVPYMESQRLHDTLTTLGVTNKYVLYPNQGHGFTGADALDSYYQIDTFMMANMPNH